MEAVMLSNKPPKTIVVIGAGPAGLTTAYELLARSRGLRVIVLETLDVVGGISRTINADGNRMDLGPHRFFSKSKEATDWFLSMLPMQGAPALDDRKLGRACAIAEGGPDPEKTDRVTLRRTRISRIFFRRKFFDYPISLKPRLFVNMGFWTTIVAGCSYTRAVLFPRKERSLEDFYVNRFGRKLYSMFFERYTENLWGRHPSQIDPSWGAQRVKGVSVLAVLREALAKAVGAGGRRKDESWLVDWFLFPKFGAGQLWETAAEKIRELGGEIRLGTRAVAFQRDEAGLVSGVVCERNGERYAIPCGALVSSMPVKDLVAGIPDAPADIVRIAAGLPYREYRILGAVLKRLLLRNTTRIKTFGNIVPDDWIYVHDRSVRMGRFQISNNFSPYVVKNPESEVFVGLEYFCSEGDDLWEMSEENFAALGVREMTALGMIEGVADVVSTLSVRVEKAYPAYFDTYEEFPKLRKWLDTIPNLYCVGRNGQHRYNNMDHSMCTGFEAARAILAGSSDRTALWNVNTEREYHESK